MKSDLNSSSSERPDMSVLKGYHIGCSGYYYSNWKNKFYPKGVAAKDYLHYYSSVFNTVELNGTFYRTPTPGQLKKYHDATGKKFSFSVKMSRYISHILRLQGSKKNIIEFQTLIKEGLQDKVKCFLFQFPASFQYTEENLNLLIENVPHHKENVIEFRHISWWNEDVINAMKNAKLTFCNVDFPTLNTPFQSTTDLFYFRLHGNPVLFKSCISGFFINPKIIAYYSRASNEFLHMKRSFVYRNGLCIVFFILMIASFYGQLYMGWKEHNTYLSDKHQPVQPMSDYLKSGHFLQATFENWESEFFQMGLFVVFTIFLRQKGSSESKKCSDENFDTTHLEIKKDSPWSVKKGGFYLAFYKHSLSIILFLLFIASFILHWYGSWIDFNEQQLLEGKVTVSFLLYIDSARLWFESFQNWQSEFLSIFAIIYLSIYLRQYGSPQSKAVNASHDQTGEN